METQYPNAKMRLVGEDGNAWAIMGRASAALRRAGASKDVIKAYTDAAMSGDYDNLLRVTMAWVACDTDRREDVECLSCGCEWEWYDINNDGLCPDCTS